MTRIHSSVCERGAHWWAKYLILDGIDKEMVERHASDEKEIRDLLKALRANSREHTSRITGGQFQDFLNCLSDNLQKLEPNKLPSGDGYYVQIQSDFMPPEPVLNAYHNTIQGGMDSSLIATGIFPAKAKMTLISFGPFQDGQVHVDGEIHPIGNSPKPLNVEQIDMKNAKKGRLRFNRKVVSHVGQGERFIEFSKTTYGEDFPEVSFKKLQFGCYVPTNPEGLYIYTIGEPGVNKPSDLHLRPDITEEELWRLPMKRIMYSEEHPCEGKNKTFFMHPAINGPLLPGKITHVKEEEGVYFCQSEELLMVKAPRDGSVGYGPHTSLARQREPLIVNPTSEDFPINVLSKLEEQYPDTSFHKTVDISLGSSTKYQASLLDEKSGFKQANRTG